MTSSGGGSGNHAGQNNNRGGARTMTSTMGGGGEVDIAALFFNRALVHACLGDDASALDDLDQAVAKETRNIT